MATTPLYEIKRSAPGSRVAIAVEMFFPAFESVSADTLHLGSLDFEVDNETYMSYLKTGSYSSKQQDGEGQDGANFAVNDSRNPSHNAGLVYEKIKIYEDVLEDVKVIIKECYELETDVWESEIVTVGYVQNLDFSGEGNTLNFDIVVDTSRGGFLVGGRIISRAMCGAKFPVGGSIDPVKDACGWLLAMGGNPLFCSHRMNGPDSCISHNNPWRFFAVRGLSSVAITITSGGIDVGGSGWPYNTGYPGIHPLYDPYQA